MSEDSASRVSAGHTAERIGYFTDAVLAIAMTLLVIEIPRPSASDFSTGPGVSKSDAVSKLWQFFLAQRPSFFAYLLAFYILWIVWREHHGLLDQVGQVSGPIIGLHFPLLLLAAFVPYATTVVGHYPDNPLANLLFGLVVGVIFICRSAIQSRAYRDDVLRPHVDRQEYRDEVVVSWTITGYWILTLALVWLAPWVQLAWALAGRGRLRHRPLPGAALRRRTTPLPVTPRLTRKVRPA